jgi:hypothetical protein
MSGEIVEAASAQWDDEQREAFILVMLDEHNQGNFTDGSFKSDAWRRIKDHFNERTGAGYTTKQLQSQLAQLKKKFMTFKALKDNSGFGWDEELKIPTAPERTWKDYLAKHPEAAVFRTSRTLPCYEELSELFDGRVAVGHFAVSSAGRRNVPAVSAPSDLSVDGPEDFSDSESEGGGPVSLAGSFHSPPGAAPSAASTAGRSSAASTASGASTSSKQSRKRSRMNDNVCASLDRIAANQTAAMTREPSGVRAMRIFNSDYPHLPLAQRVAVKAQLSKEMDKAELFLECSKEEREELFRMWA